MGRTKWAEGKTVSCNPYNVSLVLNTRTNVFSFTAFLALQNRSEDQLRRHSVLQPFQTASYKNNTQPYCLPINETPHTPESSGVHQLDTVDDGRSKKFDDLELRLRCCQHLLLYNLPV
jgi:hypothetical protein